MCTECAGRLRGSCAGAILTGGQYPGAQHPRQVQNLGCYRAAQGEPSNRGLQPTSDPSPEPTVAAEAVAGTGGDGQREVIAGAGGRHPATSVKSSERTGAPGLHTEDWGPRGAEEARTTEMAGPSGASTLATLLQEVSLGTWEHSPREGGLGWEGRWILLCGEHSRLASTGEPVPQGVLPGGRTTRNASSCDRTIRRLTN